MFERIAYKTKMVLARKLDLVHTRAKRNKWQLLGIFALICVSIYISRNILFQSGDFPTGPDSPSITVTYHLFDGNLWNAGWWPYTSLGHQWLQPYPLFFPHSLASSVDASLAWRSLIFLIPLVAAMSMYLFAKHIHRSHVAAFVSSLFYIFNPLFLMGFNAGHYNILLSYAFFPLILLCWMKAMDGKRIWMGLAGILTPTFLLAVNNIYVQLIFGSVFAFFILFNFFLAREKVGVIKNILLTSVLCIPLSMPFLYFSGYKLAHTFYAAFAQQAYFTMPAVEYWSYNSLFSATSLLFRYQLSEPYAFYTTGLPLTLKMITFLIVPILAFSALILARGKKIVLFFGMVALISIFLSKGPREPLSGMFTWIYTNIPFFDFIRVYQRWGYVTAFCYAFLVGCVFKEVTSRISFGSLKNVKKKTKSTVVKLLVCLIFVLLAFSYAYGSANLEYPKVVSPPGDFSSPFEWIEENGGGGTIVFWLPHLRIEIYLLLGAFVLGISGVLLA